MNEIVWITRVIKQWIMEWFKQKLLQGWSIDNYDEHGSSTDFAMEVTEQQWSEERFDPIMFHKMRTQMSTLGAEMNEVLRDGAMTEKSRQREWHRLKEVVLCV